MASPRALALSGLLGGILCCGLSIGIIPANRYLYQRQGLSVVGLCILIGGYGAAQRAIKEQIAIDKQIAEYEIQQQLIEEATRPAMLEEAKNNSEVSSEYRQQLHTLDAGAAFAYVAHENHPAWAQQQIEQARSESTAADSDELPTLDKLDEVVALKPAADKNLLAGVELPVAPNLGIKFFDWKRFKKESELFPHIRAVGATGIGKTCLIDWLLDVFPAGKTQVITVKRRVNQWVGLKVIGVPEDFDAIRSALDDLQAVRKKRTQKMAEGVDSSPVLNVAVDEWRVITKNLKAIADRANKEILLPSAKEVMGNMITLAREVNIRMFVMAQGRQVETWGLEGESDLAECFCSIYLGKFAIEECEAVRNRHPANSPAYEQYQAVRDYLESIGSRAAWISCADGEFPAIVPDLNSWKRGNKDEVKPMVKPVDSVNSAAEDFPADLLDRARQRLQIDFDSTSADTSITSKNGISSEAFEVPVEVQEVRDINTCGDLEVLPADERSKALSRLLGLLSQGKLEVIELMPNEPDKALWLGIKTLKMRVTPASQNIFDCGSGGSRFQKAQGWYKSLENTFGKIIE
ncbi:MAG: hypothetical protein EAZ88_09360 [Oscillatoriales cyanobacterium]|nr:MAG: hypothetical protein EAZ88_09360 [Oscillatoriales cyanobacterium]